MSGALPPPAARPLKRAARVPQPVCPGCGLCGRGTQHRPHSVRPCGPALLAVGVAEGRSRGGAFHRCERPLWSGAPPPRNARPLGGLLKSATHMLWSQAFGCGGPTLSPWPACPLGAACRGGGGGPSPRGLGCHCFEGRLVSGTVPLPAARPLGRAARVPRPVCPGCGRCGRGDPAPAPQRAPLRAGVARCRGGGRASPGGVPSTIVRNVWSQALSLPRPPVLWSGQGGFRDPCVPGAVSVGVGTQHPPHSVRPWGPTLLAVGVAEGRPRGGCLTFFWALQEGQWFSEVNVQILGHEAVALHCTGWSFKFKAHLIHHPLIFSDPRSMLRFSFICIFWCCMFCVWNL